MSKPVYEVWFKSCGNWYPESNAKYANKKHAQDRLKREQKTCPRPYEIREIN